MCNEKLLTWLPLWFRLQAQRGASQKFHEPAIEYSPWDPIVNTEHPPEVKNYRVRSIPSLADGPSQRFRNLNKRVRVTGGPKEIRKKDYDTQENIKPTPEEVVTTEQTSFKRRATTPAPSIPEKGASRIKVTRKPAQDTSPTTYKPRRQFTVRTTSENVLGTASDAPSLTKASIKRVPFTRGNFRPKPTGKPADGNASLEDQNYPEQFKLLLKNKEANVESDKSVSRKPVKPYRSPSVNKTTKPSNRQASKSNVELPIRPKAFSRATTTTTVPSTSTSAVLTTKRSFRRPRPTERTKTNLGTTIQEPPTKRATGSYATRAPLRQAPVDDALVVNTQADETKQIDPPLREYFPRTSAVS